jgi:hypothetical protein
MIFLASLLLNWSEIVRLLSLKEREKGVGDGSVEGHKYTVAQRGGEVYIVLPDYPRERCESIVKKLLQKLKPDAEIKISSIGYASSHCNYCLASFSLTYRCHRCGGWYCVEHRLPEKHNCPDEGRGSVAKRTQRKETSRKEQNKEKKEEIIAVRLPCA